MSATAAGEPLLAVEDLRVSFATPDGVVRAVDGISFELAAGRTLGVVGESGSGKSVAALTLTGLTRGPGTEVSGRVAFAGEELTRASAARLRELRGSEIGMVFQDPRAALHPQQRVGAQLVEAQQAHRAVTRAAAQARALELLELVGLPEPRRRLDAYPHQLSGGMCQRVMIAMALANEPRLLIADEPTTALDVTVQAQILALLARLRGELGMALLLITHDLAVVAELADDVVVLDAGRVVERAPTERLLSAPAAPRTRALLAAVPRLDRRAGGAAGAAERAGDAAWGRDDGERLLEVDGLVKRFPLTRGVVLRRDVGEVRAVDGVSFAIRPGEALGLVGESGCGKSTLARMLVHVLDPTAGTIRYRGVDVTGARGASLTAVRREVQIVFQDPHGALNPRRDVAAIVAEPLVVHRLAPSRGERQRRVQELLEQVGLQPAHASRYPQELSGGERQRVGIARALALGPRLIVADEPVASLDVSIQAQVLALLRELRRSLGLALLFIAHDLAVVRQVCDRVAVMRAGRLVETAPADELFERPQHPYTRELLAAVPRLERA